jgi:hypothetical protein
MAPEVFLWLTKIIFMKETATNQVVFPRFISARENNHKDKLLTPKFGKESD